MIPTVDDLRSSPMEHRFGDCFNPPGLTNFLGCVQSEIDLTAIQSLTFPPFSSSTTLTAAFVLDGVHFQSLGQSVVTTWYPDRIEREASWRGLSLRSTTILPPGLTAAIVTFEIENRSGEQRSTEIGLNIQGGVVRSDASWNTWIPPVDPGNKVTLEETRGAVIFESTKSQAVSVQGMYPMPDDARRTGFRQTIELAPGESASFTYVNAFGGNVEEALALFDRLAASAAQLVEQTTSFWNAELASIFTPGNDTYSGHLPTLVTDDQEILKLYWMGALGVVYFRRDSPHSVMGRTYDTLMPRYWQTVTFLWDYSLSAGVHAQLDPSVMKRYLEHWMHIDIYKHFGTEYLTGGPVGNWYSVNDFAMVSMSREYVKWTGDTAWLSSKVAGSDKTVSDYLAEYALKWKSFATPNGLADYGGLNNLLECVSTYVHEVASLNAANVHNMRVAAELLTIAGRAGEAPALRDEAERLLGSLRELYVEGKGFWYARYPDGSMQEVRHCYDLLTVLNTIPDDLAADEKRDMVAFFENELMTNVWMHALSPKDDNVLFDIRPDHQWTGAYPAWPPETTKGLYRIGKADLAFRWLKGLAKSANQGPFGQGHFAETVLESEDGGARKAPYEFPYITDWCCSSNGSWTTAIIEGIFGVNATPAHGLTANPQFASFDPDAVLKNVQYQGKLYEVTQSGLTTQ